MNSAAKQNKTLPLIAVDDRRWLKGKKMKANDARKKDAPAPGLVITNNQTAKHQLINIHRQNARLRHICCPPCMRRG